MSVFFTSHLIEAKQVISSNDRLKPPLKSVISKITLLRNKVENIPIDSRIPFPWKVSDERITYRIRNLLGIEGTEPYLVHNKSVNDWLKDIQSLLSNTQVHEIFLTGSASVFGVNSPFLLNAYQQTKTAPNVAIEKLLKKRKYRFGDVDIKMRVSEETDLVLFELSIQKIEGCKINFSNHQVVNLTVSDSKQKIDFVIFKQLSSDFAFYSDDFGIHLNQSKLNENIIVVNSINPWKWLKCQTLGLIENEGRLDYHLYSRLLGKLLKGEVCTDNLEDRLFNCWIDYLKRLQSDPYQNSLKKDSLKFLLDKQWNDHESGVVLSRYLLSLRAQQKLLQNHIPGSFLSQTVNIDLKGEIPAFIKFVFQAMNANKSNIAAVHGAIECIALIALCEGWDAPFQVKLVSHQGEWVLRLRFRGNADFKDLLVRFDINASLKALHGGYTENIRDIVRSLSIDGISRRVRTKDYNKQLIEYGLTETVAADIRKCLLRTSKYDGKSIFAEQSSLAELEMDMCGDHNQLLNIGFYVFKHYVHAPALRLKICWKIVDECLLESAEFVNLLRSSGEVPKGNYASLFKRVLDRGGDIEIYKASSPFPEISDDNWALVAKEKISKPTILAPILDGVKCSAELFLQFIQLNHVQKHSLSEEMLCKLIIFRPKDINHWIRKFDREDYCSDSYKKSLTDLICEMPHLFDESWIFNWIYLGKFIGNEKQRLELCKYFVYSHISLLIKTQFLDLLEIEKLSENLLITEECKSLWQYVANECVSHSEILPPIFHKLRDVDLKVIVTCFEIIVLRESSAVRLQKLDKIKHFMTDALRASVLIRLLRTWNTCSEDIPLLEFFDIHKNKINWNQLKSDAKKPVDLLELKNKIPLLLYTQLFRSLLPERDHYQSCWVEKVSNSFKAKGPDSLLGYLEKPYVKECLRFVKKKSLILINQVDHCGRGMALTLELFETVSEEHFLKMVKAALDFKDNNQMALKLCSKFLSNKFKKNPECTLILVELCHRMLVQPKCDFKVLRLICEFLGEIPAPREGILTVNLMKFIRSGLDEYVNELHRRFPSIINDEIVYELLLNADSLEKKSMILLDCQKISEVGRMTLINILHDHRLNADIAGRLIMKCLDFEFSKVEIAKLATHVLSRCENTHVSLGNNARKYLVMQLPELDLSQAHSLWEALRVSHAIKKDILWREAINLFERCHHDVGESFLQWMASNCKPENHELLLKALQRIIDGELWDSEELSDLEPLISWLRKVGLDESENSKQARILTRRIDKELEEVLPKEWSKIALSLLDQCFHGSYSLIDMFSQLPVKHKTATLLGVAAINYFFDMTVKTAFGAYMAVEMGYGYHRAVGKIAKLTSAITANRQNISFCMINTLGGVTSGVVPLWALYNLSGNMRLFHPLLYGGTIGAASAGSLVVDKLEEMIVPGRSESTPKYLRIAAQVTGVSLAVLCRQNLSKYNPLYGTMSPALAFFVTVIISATFMILLSKKQK
jgi:hypothetical protein